jgi:hypothetical protein
VDVVRVLQVVVDGRGLRRDVNLGADVDEGWKAVWITRRRLSPPRAKTEAMVQARTAIPVAKVRPSAGEADHTMPTLAAPQRL